MFNNSFHTGSFRFTKFTGIILVYLIFILSGTKLASQKASFRKYSVLDGLPQSQVRKIVQDSRGFLWICTGNGLSRFDGIEFVNYYRANGLPDNQVADVFEDNFSKLWVLSGTGLSKYNGEAFDYFRPPPEFAHWLFGFSSSVDTLNNIFLIGERPSDNIRRIILFRDGVYGDYAKNYPALDTLKVMEAICDKSAGAMLIRDKFQKIWIWKDNVLTPLSGRKIQLISVEHNDIMARSNDTLFKYSGGKLERYYFKTSQGRWNVNENIIFPDKQIELLNGIDSFRLLLPFNYSSYYVDKENVMWFCSEGNMFRLLSLAFRIISDEDLKSGNFWAIAEDRNGHIFLGSLYNSLIEFDGKAFRERREFRALFKKGVSFYKGSRKMANGDVWFSTNMGVIIWNGNTFSVLKGIPGDTQICYIYEDTDNKTVMLGTEKGLFVLQNNRIDLLTEFTDTGLGVIEGITRDDSGIYWLSGHKGVVKYNGKTAVAVRENILPEQSTYTIEKDRFGGLWVTSENGLYLRKKGDGNFITGLPEALNGPANSIILMDSLHILVGRVNDICIIDLEKFYSNDRNYFRMYNNTDGFMGSDCLDNGIIKSVSGQFLILTSDNTVIFDPRKLEMNPDPPQLNITGIQYETDSMTWKTVDKSDFFYGVPANIKLKRFQNRIRISFTGISTTNPEKVMLQYRLEGYDDKWSVPASKRFVIYENLPPGHYRFVVRAFNADGVETVHPLVVSIIMTPTIWQRAIIRILIFLLCICLTVWLSLFFIKRNLGRKEEESRLRQELSRLQMNSILRQFDPHFTFNVISAIGSVIMRGDKENAYDYITILGALLRTVLGEGSVIIKPLSEEVDFVRRYCELQKLRFDERIGFSLLIDKDVDMKRTIPKMTIQLFVENAIKHGFEDRMDGGKVEVIISRKIRSIEIRIIDNGIGRVAAARQPSIGSGSGLKMITRLFEESNSHNSSISTIEITDLEESGVPAGTSVRIEIPDDYKFESGNSGAFAQN